MARLKNGIARIAGSEIKLFPKARMAMRDVVLAIFAEVFAVGVDNGGSVVVDAGHLDFVDGDDEHHLIFLGDLLHMGDGGACRDAFG